MGRKRVFHFVGTRFEGVEQIAMAALEVLKDVGAVAARHLRIERQDPVDDMVRPGLVGRVEVARFDRRLEGPHDHPGGIGAQMQRPAGSGMGL